MFIWSPGMTLDYLERTSIEQALKFYQGNKTTTAKALGCAVNTINSKLDKYAQEDRDARIRAEKDAARSAEFDRRQRGVVPGTGFPYRDPNVTASAIANAIGGQDAETPQKASNGAGTGVPVESAAGTTQKPAVSLPERKEVQSVLPKSSSSGGKKGRG